jgi:hypothetical protein
MKNLKFAFLLLLLPALLVSCEKKQDLRALKMERSVEKVVKAPLISMADWPEDGCGLQTFDLIAGQYMFVGAVHTIMSGDGQTLFVKYETYGDCEITEAHLFVGNSFSVIPTGKTGNPKIGHFPYFWEDMGSATEVVFSIDVEDLGLTDDCFKIAAHAVTVCDGREETAWARGSDLVFSLKVYYNEGEYKGLMADESFAGGSDWQSHMIYYPLAYALDNPIDLKSILDGSSPFGTAEVVEAGGDHQLVITAPDGLEISKTFIYIGPEEAFHTDVQNWPVIDTWNSPVNPLVIPVSISDVLAGQEFSGSRWGWYVEYCPAHCLDLD